jgi:hypothetical protein
MAAAAERVVVVVRAAAEGRLGIQARMDLAVPPAVPAGALAGRMVEADTGAPEAPAESAALVAAPRGLVAAAAAAVETTGLADPHTARKAGRTSVSEAAVEAEQVEEEVAVVAEAGLAEAGLAERARMVGTAMPAERVAQAPRRVG